MSAPLRSEGGQLNNSTAKGNSCVRRRQVGGIKLHDEKITTKLALKGPNVTSPLVIGYRAWSTRRTFRITNLKRIIHHNRILAEHGTRARALGPSILSLVSMLFRNNNGIPRREENKCARNRLRNAQAGNYGITYGRGRAPNNTIVGPTRHGGHIGCGDGTVTRTVAFESSVRTLSTKAGNKVATRGSVGEISRTSTVVPINITSISSRKNLITAWESIKSKPGNMTPGTDRKTTLDGISLKYLDRIGNEIRAGKYKFSPARRVQIPKPGKKETRPLDVASPREKVIQKAIQQVMEPHYEPEFQDCSHGFRPRRGTRTAIQYLDSKFQSVQYIIEADFTKAFPSINHDKLMKILREKIRCDKTLRLIKSSLTAGHIEDMGNIHRGSEVGTPQGAILSPLLCNIYLNALDTHIETIKKNFEKGEKRKKTPEYNKLANKIKYWRAKGYDKERPRKYKEIETSMMNTPSMVRDDTYIRIQYVRYADDFVVGIEGSYKIAKQVMECIREFTERELKLKLHPEKTGITKYTETPVRFLGFKISAPHIKNIAKPYEVVRTNGKTVRRRKKIRIRIYMDTEKVIKKLQVRGIVKKKTAHWNHRRETYGGTFVGNLINLDHRDIIVYYNSVIRGIYNYYDFVNNKNDLAWIIWLITESCALTLARKMKIRALGRVFEKLGKSLAYETKDEKGEETASVGILQLKDLTPGNLATKRNRTEEDPFSTLRKNWNAKLTRSSLFEGCIICGSKDNVEMHHVRKIKGIRNKRDVDFFTKQMAIINRKQIPLCRKHHEGLHLNTWTHEETQIYKDRTTRTPKKGTGRNREGGG